MKVQIIDKTKGNDESKEYTGTICLYFYSEKAVLIGAFRGSVDDLYLQVIGKDEE